MSVNRGHASVSFSARQREGNFHDANRVRENCSAFIEVLALRARTGKFFFLSSFFPIPHMHAKPSVAVVSSCTYRAREESEKEEEEEKMCRSNAHTHECVCVCLLSARRALVVLEGGDGCAAKKGRKEEDIDRGGLLSFCAYHTHK